MKSKVKEEVNKMLPQAKSYTSIYEIFGSSPFSNVLYKSPRKNDKDRYTCTTNCGDCEHKTDIKELTNDHHAKYVTSENYHHLNKDVSYKSMVRSSSTIFYDLDDIAKRHSFHCLTEISISNANLLKVLKIPATTNVFGGRSEAVVQECATQIQPKLLTRDSIENNVKKAKRKFYRDSILSSEIFLRDEEYTNHYNKNHHYDKNISDKQQKFWSYAKYRTEYTNPVTEVKKHRKKEKEKQTEDPCPCQLFSYVCPCTDKKSLTELAKSSKSITVIDQVTSTTNFFEDETREMKKKATKRQKRHKFKEEKLTGVSPIETVESMVYKNKSMTEVVINHDTPKINHILDRDQGSVKSKPKSYRKSRKIICPNCKEKVEIVSTTEEDENLKCDSSTYGSKEISPTTAYACRAPLSKNHKGKIENDGDICFHDPRCEMVPVCQILPCDDNYLNSKTNKSQTSPKQNARVIRITKACRHHPPCTVVPSCQRANVLKNNCEYIPPCLHRPRCVNLPLCVPFSKSMHYEEANKHVDEKDNAECLHVPRCKYIPLCQHDSLVNNVNHQIHMIPQMQHACEFMNGYQTPAFLITPQTNCMPNSYSPCQVSSPNTCSYKPSKSCQYDCTDNKCYTFNIPKASESNEMVVFIRDVGCQFRNKNYSPKESVLQSKVSSGSIDFVDVKMDKYYSDVHTLRYEDKFTNPISGGEVSMSSGSLSTSVEINTHSPSQEQHASRNSPRFRQTGFSPEAEYVTAFNIYGTPTATTAHISPNNIKEMIKCDAQTCRDCLNQSNVKSRKSLLNHKYRKIFNRRKKCSSRHVNVNRSKQIIYLKTVEKNNYV